MVVVHTKVGRLGVFRGAVGLALRDGLLSNGEKRLLVKMAHALRLDEDQPKAAYDAVLAGEEIEAGEYLGLEETRRVYEQVLEAFLLHTDRSEAELILVAYLRHTFNIDDAEHRAIARSMDRQLDQVVHRTVAQDFKIKLDEANLRLADLFGLDIFDKN
jgi:Arc/MetJ family transcription regulator